MGSHCGKRWGTNEINIVEDEGQIICRFVCVWEAEKKAGKCNSMEVNRKMERGNNLERIPRNVRCSSLQVCANSSAFYWACLSCWLWATGSVWSFPRKRLLRKEKGKFEGGNKGRLAGGCEREKGAGKVGRLHGPLREG